MTNRRHKQEHGRKEGREFPHGQRPRLRLQKRNDDHDRNGGHRDELGKRRRRRLHALRAQKEILQSVVDLEKALCFVFISVVYLHHALTFVGLLKRSDELAEDILRLRGKPLDALIHPTQENGQKRSNHESEERQTPVVINQHANKTDDLNAVSNDRRHDGSGTAQSGRRFVDKLRLNARAFVFLNEVVVPVKNPIEHERANFDQHVLRNPNE